MLIYGETLLKKFDHYIKATELYKY